MTVTQDTRVPISGRSPAAEAARQSYVAGLRTLADLLEQRPELVAPHTGTVPATPIYVMVARPQEADQFELWPHLLADPIVSVTRQGRRELNGTLGGLRISVLAYEMPAVA